MLALRRAGLAASLVACAACVVLLRSLVLADPMPFPALERWLGTRVGPFAQRMQFGNALSFALLALLAVAALALAASWKGSRLPTPVRDVRLDGPEHAFLAPGVWARGSLASFAAAEAAVVVLMLRDSIPPAWLWAAGLAALGALAALADRSAPVRPSGGPPVGPAEVAGVLLVTAACAGITSYRLGGWEWAGTPDSYAFYGMARQLYEGVVKQDFLSPDGAFAMYTIASSWMQAALFPVLGPSGAALRAGNVLLVAALAVLGHVFARPLVGRAGAFATSALLGSSVLVQTFARKGYNNLQGVFFAMLALAFASRAAATRRWTPLVLAGMAAGAGLMSYALAAISGVAVLLWFALSGRPSVRSLRAAAVFVLASVAAAAPCLLSRHYMRVHMVKVSAFSPELIAAGPRATPLSSRVLHAVAQPVLNDNPGHAAAGPRLDPVSALLLLVGVAALAGGAGPRTASRALLAVALFWPVAIGLLQPYAFPSSPWMLLATPAWAILGGCGVAALVGALPFAPAAGIVALLTLPAVAWSTWQVQVSSLRAAPLQPLAFTVAAAQAAAALPAGAPAVLLVPMLSVGEGAPVREAARAFAPTVRVETPQFSDPALPARLAALREEPAILVLWEGGDIPARDEAWLSARNAWPGAREVLYRTLPAPAGGPCVRVLVNEKARSAVAFLPMRDRTEE